ncbi:hypothetical protein HYU14_07195 [Candidatus Woesearchaeota archaeon]|nr:hypothetical protein [Candidatus Woesearchaeota archaeon]
MPTTRVQQYILFTLGKWIEEANESIKEKPLEISISKNHFIGLVLKGEFAEKQERALYKNLEILEKKKLISYGNKEMKLTPRGQRLYQEINKRIMPYVDVFRKLKEKDPISYTKKAQTIFR